MFIYYEHLHNLALKLNNTDHEKGMYFITNVYNDFGCTR